MMEWLLKEAKADPLVSRRGSVLHKAAWYAQKRDCQVLLKDGRVRANVNKVNKENQTPLHFACTKRLMVS